MHSSELEPKPESEWTCCRPGTLGTGAPKPKYPARRKLLIMALQGSATLLVATPVAGVAFFAFRASGVHDLSCREVHRLLPSYAGGRLSQRSRQAVEMHLAKCVSCQDQLDELKV